MLEQPQAGGSRTSAAGRLGGRLPPLFVSSGIYRATGYNRNHPLAIARLGPVMDICAALGWLNRENYRQSPIASIGELTGFHDPSYVRALAEASRTGVVSRAARELYHLGNMENPVFPGLFERAATSVGGSMLAARLALEGRVVFHPAGGTHHGRRDRASGFCYFNDPVFAIREFLGHGLVRVAYVDLDAHHGDGVEAAFADDARVLCISIHEAGRWPGTGAQHTANALNFPAPRGFDDAGLAAMMTDFVVPALTGFAPQAVVVTCGADGLAGDPLSSMQLSNVALWDAVVGVVGLAPRAVVVGGGGYNPWTTVRCWAGLWGRLNGWEMPARLPEKVRAMLLDFSCELVDTDEIDPAWLESLADRPAPGTGDMR